MKNRLALATVLALGLSLACDQLQAPTDVVFAKGGNGKGNGNGGGNEDPPGPQGVVQLLIGNPDPNPSPLQVPLDLLWPGGGMEGDMYICTRDAVIVTIPIDDSGTVGELVDDYRFSFFNPLGSGLPCIELLIDCAVVELPGPGPAGISMEWINLDDCTPAVCPDNIWVPHPFVPDKFKQTLIEPPFCEGDANGDGTVDPLDSGYVLARFGCPVGTGDADCDAADVNGDGAVDPLDSGFVLARFGTCD